MATPEASPGVFPDVERVFYGKAPLVEVVCQARYPADLRIETEPPTAFQQRVRAQFPILQRRTQSLTGVPAEVLRAMEAVIPPSSLGTVWRFATEDGKQSLELTKDNLTLLSRSYERWEDFFTAYKLALGAMIEMYEPPFMTRVGLRYKDFLKRSKLGLDGVPWRELLQEHVLGELGVDNLEERAIEATRSLLLRLPEREAKVRLQHGIAEEQGKPEQCYLIDCDFYVERTGVNDVEDSLEYLHAQAARYFHWCIKPALHDAMDPQPMAPR